MEPTLALFGHFGWQEAVLLAVLGLLIFGRRLPEVGRNLGKGIVEFKKGLSGVQEEIEKAGGPAEESSTPDTADDDTDTAVAGGEEPEESEDEEKPSSSNA
ncbi:MAG: twin-arginine translocase TatA/TatE family subunit [Phycisphaeraceae bacterium]|nr:twin-arginine translocase TatA/TatE family subunit [Phycisphaeraceae bacterium]